MFKKFTTDDVSAITKVKSSVTRGMKRSILELYPSMEERLDDMLPKGQVEEAKCKDRVNMVTVNKQAMFVRHRTDPYIPTLRVLHQYPNMMNRVQVDKGAIRFVLNGADIMCPGLTSPGGDVSADLPVGTPVAIYAEGKEHALAIGILSMSTEEIRTVNKGIGITIVHYLNDGLWKAIDLV